MMLYFANKLTEIQLVSSIKAPMPGPEPNDLQPDELVVLSLVESMEAPLPSSGEFIMGTAALTSQLTADTGELNLPDLGELILPDAAELNLDPVGFTETPVDELEEPDLEPVASTDALTPELEEFNLQPVESTEMPPPTNTEELSLQLLASLMLEDVQQLLSAQQESDLTFEDDTAALEASQMELEILLQSIQDQALAESLREAGASDFVAPPTEAGGDQSRADSLARLLGVQEEAAALYEKVECVSCGEMHSLHDILVTQCEHTYCKGCLIELFEHATRDEELYPVRCCRDKLPLERFKRWIAPDLLELYEEKRVEYESVDRIYCADPKCAKFITSENVDKPTSIATCSTCSKTTCKLCNRESHGNGECPEDITMQSLLEIARVNNWKRCYNCHSMIGISTGCNHMM